MPTGCFLIWILWLIMSSPNEGGEETTLLEGNPTLPKCCTHSWCVPNCSVTGIVYHVIIFFITCQQILLFLQLLLPLLGLNNILFPQLWLKLSIAVSVECVVEMFVVSCYNFYQQNVPHTHAHTHTNMYTHACNTHTYTHSHVSRCMPTHTHVYKHTHACNTHTHMHTTHM